jgi:peptidoglycan lytic transglycosylase B
MSVATSWCLSRCQGPCWGGRIALPPVRSFVRCRAAPLVTLVLVFLVGVAGPARATDNPSFDTWLDGMRRDALADGVRPETVCAAFDTARFVPEVQEFDRRQPEFLSTFWGYIDQRVTPERIGNGRIFLRQHRGLLDAVYRRYGVPPEVIAAFIGLESNYGRNTGGFRTVDALATLAFDDRRGPMFHRQLLAFLHLADRGDVPVDAVSSWAGAMGQPQFMPTTYDAYAVDFDGDGRRDLWNSPADIFASAGHFLSELGWRAEEEWGTEVILPSSLDVRHLTLDTPKPIADWRRMGVRRSDGRPFGPDDTTKVSLVVPGGWSGGPALLVGDNFDAILGWNRSILYAVSVGHLADRLAGGGEFRTGRSGAPLSPMSRNDVVELQTMLARLGYDTGGTDGVVGSKTRSAIRQFQMVANLPADGYPSSLILDRLRQGHDRQ